MSIFHTPRSEATPAPTPQPPKGLISTERLKRTVKLLIPKVHIPLQLATTAQRRASSRSNHAVTRTAHISPIKLKSQPPRNAHPSAEWQAVETENEPDLDV